MKFNLFKNLICTILTLFNGASAFANESEKFPMQKIRLQDTWQEDSLGKHIVSIQYSPHDRCSGVLVGPRHILTSSSCINPNIDLEHTDREAAFSKIDAQYTHLNMYCERTRCPIANLKGYQKVWNKYYSLKILASERTPTLAIHSKWVLLEITPRYPNTEIYHATSWLPVRSFQEADHDQIQILGVPTESISVHFSKCRLTSRSPDTRALYYSCLTQSGIRGGPMISTNESPTAVVGIHHKDSINASSFEFRGVKLTDSQVQDINTALAEADK